ncbi:MAG TPA: HlyD family efflux transporter periplasmic adaptor subunit, partial [Propionibacterium sp.]|nr:HlyD family efflux transporter periplasmic adaptor subunit [Propionibacterium sp.]
MADETWVVTMPKLGETVTEGTIGSWLKNVGDTVEFDDPLFEVSTDKVDSEIPSPYDGVILEIYVQAGETVPVGTDVVRIGPPGSTPGAAAPAAEAPAADAPAADAQAGESA